MTRTRFFFHLAIPFLALSDLGMAQSPPSEKDPAPATSSQPGKSLRLQPILVLNAGIGVTTEEGDRVSIWKNGAPDFPAVDFVKRDEGRKEPGSGRPTLRKNIPEIGGGSAIVFRQQELVCLDEDAFDRLSQGGGCTWIAVLAPHEQRVGLKDVNSFFGNLKNSGNYEGIWGCLNDDNTPWWGARNGLTFGRFDANNPQLLGPKLEAGKFVVLAGRMAAGTGKVKLELFINSAGKPAATGEIEVNPQANPSRMAIGQERDAVNHPGHEAFDGEIAHFLIYAEPLDDRDLNLSMKMLESLYAPAKPAPAGSSKTSSNLSL